MRMSDWSSDVCSSDLAVRVLDLGEVDLLEACHQRQRHRLGGLVDRAEDEHGDAVDAARGVAALGVSLGILRDRNLARRGGNAIGVENHDHAAVAEDGRSEEHTSELQSLMRISYAVLCLKKKNTNNNRYPI